MNPNRKNDVKKSTILQQAEHHMIHGHTILHREKDMVIEKRLLILEQNTSEITKHLLGKNQHQNNPMTNPYIESTIVNHLTTIMESKICQIVEHSIEKILSNNNNQPIKQNINDNVTNQTNDIKLNDTNGNDILNRIESLIENQHEVVMSSFNEVKKIQYNQHNKLTEIRNEMEETKHKIMEENNNNFQEVYEKMKGIEKNVKDLQETIDERRSKSKNEIVQDGIIYGNNVHSKGSNTFIENRNVEDCIIGENETDNIDVNDSNENGTISNNIKAGNFNFNFSLVRSMMKLVAPNDENYTLPIKTVKNVNNKFLFVEAKADFVNLLQLVQRVPIGIFLQNLPDDQFVLSQADTLISSDLNIKKYDILESSPVEVTLESGGSMVCDGSGNGPFTCKASNDTWKNAVAFRGLGNSFEISLLLPNNPSGMMLGILPDDSNLSSRCKMQYVHNYYGFFLHPNSCGITWPSSNKNYPIIFQHTTPINGKELKMRFQQAPQKLHYSYDDGPWYQFEIQKAYGIEPTTNCCPVILSSALYNPITVTEVKSLDQKLEKSNVLKSNSTYLISNKLEISNSLVDLYQKYQVEDSATLQISTINFGHVELGKLIYCILKGERNALEVALSSN